MFNILSNLLNFIFLSENKDNYFFKKDRNGKLFIEDNIERQKILNPVITESFSNV